MATTPKNDVELFKVVNSAAVDIASIAAITSLDVDVAVKSFDGASTVPLFTTDEVVSVRLSATLLSNIAVQTMKVKDVSTITLRITNPSAAAVDPPSVAIGTIVFVIAR